MSRTVAAVAAGIAVAACLVSLLLGWAVIDGEAEGFFALISNSSALTAALGVAYLVATVVSLGFAGTALFTPPPKHRWYALAAVCVALADCGVVATLWYRIGRSGAIDPAAGVYAAALAAVAAVVVAVIAIKGYPGAAKQPHG